MAQPCPPEEGDRGKASRGFPVPKQYPSTSHHPERKARPPTGSAILRDIEAKRRWRNHIPSKRGTEAKPRGGFPSRSKTLPRHTIRSAKRDRRQGRRPCATLKRSEDGATLSPRKRGTEAKPRGGFPSRNKTLPRHTIWSAKRDRRQRRRPCTTPERSARQGASVGGATRKRLHSALPKHPQKPTQAGLSCSNLLRNRKIDGFGTSKTPSSRVSLGQL